MTAFKNNLVNLCRSTLLKKKKAFFWVASLLFPNMRYFLQIIRKACTWLFDPSFLLQELLCHGGWGRMSLPLCFIKRVTFRVLCHLTSHLLSVHLMKTQVPSTCCLSVLEYKKEVKFSVLFKDFEEVLPHKITKAYIKPS